MGHQEQVPVFEQAQQSVFNSSHAWKCSGPDTPKQHQRTADDESSLSHCLTSPVSRPRSCTLETQQRRQPTTNQLEHPASAAEVITLHTTKCGSLYLSFTKGHQKTGTVEIQIIETSVAHFSSHLSWTTDQRDDGRSPTGSTQFYVLSHLKSHRQGLTMCQQAEPQTITCSPTLAVSFSTYIHKHALHLHVCLTQHPDSSPTSVLFPVHCSERQLMFSVN